MKGKIFALIIIASLISGGLTLISCKSPCEIEAGGCAFSVDSAGKSTTTVCANKDCIISKTISATDDLTDDELLNAFKDGCDCK